MRAVAHVLRNDDTDIKCVHKITHRQSTWSVIAGNKLRIILREHLQYTVIKTTDKKIVCLCRSFSQVNIIVRPCYMSQTDNTYESQQDSTCSCYRMTVRSLMSSCNIKNTLYNVTSNTDSKLYERPLSFIYSHS